MGRSWKLPYFLAAAVAISMVHSAECRAQVTAQLDIDKITCREALKMTGDERAFTVIYFHGFMSGKKNETHFDGPALSEATDKIADYCIDNPSETLLKSFETIRK